MDLNLVVIAGRLAAPPEARVFETGTRLIRYLVTVRSDNPHRRLDVVPVTLWNPPAELLEEDPQPGHRLMVVGAVQRRFWPAPDGRRSRLEVIADHITLPTVQEDVGAV